MVANNSSESQSDSDTPAIDFRLLFTKGYSVFDAAQVMATR